MKKKTLVVMGLFFIIALNSGCSFIWTGHRIDLSKMENIKIGETSRQNILDIYGEPHDIIKKKVEKITIYVYKFVRNTSIAIPFVISFGKTKVNGYQVNITISDDTDKVANYEVMRFEETL